MEWYGGKNKEIPSVSTRETDTLLDVGGMNDGYCCSGGVLSVPEGPMGWGKERLPRSGYTADVGRVIEVGENGLKSENCSVRLQNRPHVHRSWPHCTTFLLNDNQSITVIVLTLDRLGGQEVQCCSVLSRRCSLWGWRKKERVGWAVLLGDRAHRWQRFVIVIFPIKHFDLAATKERVSAEKENKCSSHQWGSLSCVSTWNRVGPQHWVGGAAYGSSGSPSLEELASDPQSLSHLGHTLIMGPI